VKSEELKAPRTKNAVKQTKKQTQNKNRSRIYCLFSYDSRANPTERETRAEFQKMDEWMVGWMDGQQVGRVLYASPVGTWESSFGSDNPAMAESNYRK